MINGNKDSFFPQKHVLGLCGKAVVGREAARVEYATWEKYFPGHSWESSWLP